MFIVLSWGVNLYDKADAMLDTEIQSKTPELGTNPKDILGIKKVSLSKFPPAATLYGALAMQDGARKYGPYNWRENKVIASIYIDACDRHLKSWFDGEECAADSGYPHLAHALACIAIIIDAHETGNLVDDRPVKGAFSDLLARWTKK